MDDIKFAAHDGTASARPSRHYGGHPPALNTEEMKMPVAFYFGVLGMRLVHAMKVPPGVGTGPGNRGNPPFEEIRHYFSDMGRDGLLALFEIPKGAKPKGDRDAIGTMQHVAFAVSPETAARLQARLTERGIDTQLVEHAPGQKYSLYFYAPNAIRLKLPCQPPDGAEPRIIDAFTQSKV